MQAPIQLSSAAVLYGCRHRTTRKRKPDDVDRKVDEALSNIKSDSIGPFWFQKSTVVQATTGIFHVGLQQREKVELDEIVRSGFISDEFLKNTLIPLNDESSIVPRLRMYNWAVTNYAKGHGITTQIQDKNGNIRFIDPSISYNSALKRLHRTLFDPYRRGTLLFFKVADDTHHTTVGQLLFVKWCVENGIDKYVEAHQTDIRDHLNKTTKERAQKGKQRVKELTTTKCPYARMISSGPLDVKDGAINSKKLKQ